LINLSYEIDKKVEDKKTNTLLSQVNTLVDVTQPLINESDTYMQNSGSNLFINNYNTQNFYATPFNFPIYPESHNNVYNNNQNYISNNKPLMYDKNRLNKFKINELEQDYLNFSNKKNFV
jgi:hypothetical protein